MPVTIKKKALTLTTLVKRLFDASSVGSLMAQAKAIEAVGCKLKSTPSSLTITGPSGEIATANVKLSAVQNGMKGNLSYVGKKALTSHIKNFIGNAYNSLDEVKEYELEQKVLEVVYKDGKTNKVAGIKFYREKTGSDLKAAKDWVEALMAKHPAPKKDAPEPEIAVGTINFDAEPVVQTADPKGKPVDLTAATKLSQPVRGTSGGSIYHVIALGEDATVAVRIKTGNNIAIRAVAKTNKGASNIKAAGLDAKEGGHYSLHLSPDSASLVPKAVGAVLFAMNLPWTGIVGNVNSLVGVGK